MTANAAVGWIGTGRMGTSMVRRLRAAGTDVAVWNRTPQKAEALVEVGARAVGSAAELAGHRLVFTMVSNSAALEAVVLGSDGLLAAGAPAPEVLIDCSTVSIETSALIRRAAAEQGTAFLAAPVSGNTTMVDSGRLAVAVSGPEDAYREALPVLEQLAGRVAYVGDGELARIAKICHQLMLSVVMQGLVEATVLAEKVGMRRSDFLDFINGSVLGCPFTGYKSPGLIALDFAPTFTTDLLRKDLLIGTELAREADVPLPLAAAVHELLVALQGKGHGDADFAALLLQQAQDAGMQLRPEAADADEPGPSPAQGQ